jgi:hypothetical protein
MRGNEFISFTIMPVLQVVAHLPNLNSKEVFFQANIRMQLNREKCDSLRVEVMLMEGLKAFSFRAYFVANYGVVELSQVFFIVEEKLVFVDSPGPRLPPW